MVRRAGLAAGLFLLAGLLATGHTCLTVDARVLDMNTAEFKAYPITVNLTGIEIFGFRFGVSPQDIARGVAKEIAFRVGRECREREEGWHVCLGNVTSQALTPKAHGRGRGNGLVDISLVVGPAVELSLLAAQPAAPSFPHLTKEVRFLGICGVDGGTGGDTDEEIADQIVRQPKDAGADWVAVKCGDGSSFHLDKERSLAKWRVLRPGFTFGRRTVTKASPMLRFGRLPCQ